MSNPKTPQGQEEVIPVLAEELIVGKRDVQTGGVRVSRRILEHDEVIDIGLLKEHVEVKRVVHDRPVEGPLPVRQEGNVTVIPIVEEELVISKRYRLKEEIHVTRQVREERHVEHVTVRRQQAQVERLDEDGHPQPVERSEIQRAPRKRILGDR